MERWYIGFYAYGRYSCDRKIEEFSKRVNYYKLGELVSHVCLEKGAIEKKQYLFFMGIESQQKGFIPPEFQERFDHLKSDMSFRDQGVVGYFEEISSMVGDEIEIDRVLQVKTWRPPKREQIDPYSYITLDDSKIEQAPNFSDKYNQLLYWLSAYGRGTWQQFRSTCEALDLDRNGKYAGRIMRRLRSLGHVELARGGQYWFIAPSCFIETPFVLNKYQIALAGQRTPLLIKYLEEFTTIECEPQPNGNAPEAIRVSFSDRHDIDAFIKDFQQHYSVYLAGQASLNIASELPDLSTWEQNLPTLAVVTGYYNCEQWIDGRFQAVGSPNETGMYRLTHRTDRFDHPQMTLYYDVERDEWRRADWYGLRYLMLKRTGAQCEFHYNHRLQTLKINEDVRLPDMYERALVLASGRLPIRGNKQIIFGAISDELAHIIAHKLEAELTEIKGI